jgi:rare lipoprotein A (peptidoglycan hydrolase)
MNRILFIGVIGLAVLMPCAAQQTVVQTVEGLASRYRSPQPDTAFYAKHAKLPIGSRVKVTNLENNKNVVVEIAGRIPGNNSRWLIDICASAADVLEMKENVTGFTRVRLEEAPKAAKTKPFNRFMQTGPASWQLEGPGFTAAHPSLPLASQVLITNPANGRHAIATIVGRVPAKKYRVIELSKPLALALGLEGTAEVTIESLKKGATR